MGAGDLIGPAEVGVMLETPLGTAPSQPPAPGQLDLTQTACLVLRALGMGARSSCQGCAGGTNRQQAACTGRGWERGALPVTGTRSRRLGPVMNGARRSAGEEQRCWGCAGSSAPEMSGAVRTQHRTLRPGA